MTSLETWQSYALLTRHYAGLPGLVARFLSGPEKDGPEITEEKAAEIIAEAYGRATRCTYAGLRRVDPGELKAQIKNIVGESVSTAEAVALAECLGKLHIMQPVCVNGHLPTRFTGPTSFAFMGTDQQCPVCRGRVADPDALEFNLIWTEGRLGHRAEKEVDGGDGRLVPTTDAGILAAIGELHPWWKKSVDGVTPAIAEIALTLRHGLANGIAAIPNGMDVLEALRDPRTARLDEWRCESVLRKARGTWRIARNPFVVQVVLVAQVQPTQNMGPAHDALRRLIVSLNSLEEMRRFAKYYTQGDEIIASIKPGSPAEVAEQIVVQWHARGLIDRRLFGTIVADRPRRKPDIDAVARLFGY